METLRKRSCSRALLCALGASLFTLIVGEFAKTTEASVLLYVLPAACFLFVFGCVLWFELFQALTMNGECPTCHRRGMRKIARSSTFFECIYCHARLKRSSPTAQWEDASSAEADRLYRATPEGGQWRSYEVPNPGDNTSGQLLRSKRTRDGGPVLEETISAQSPREITRDAGCSPGD